MTRGRLSHGGIRAESRAPAPRGLTNSPAPNDIKVKKQMHQAQLTDVPLLDLVPHPLNPRIAPRPDVVDSIHRQIDKAKTFPREHALLVRPLNGGYQIVSGHQRALAARAAGLQHVPCWVRPMDDATAFFELVLSNSQGELTPLEIGLHALQAIPPEKGGRGKRGGLSEYAEKLGKSKQYICELRDAAEVYAATKLSAQADGLGDKAKHLAAIHRADPRAWAPAVEALQKGDWSLSETETFVERVAEFDISSKWEEVFLPYERVLKRFLGGDEFSAKTVSSLCALAESTVAQIEAAENAPLMNRDRAKSDFLSWLKENIGGESWSQRRITAKQQELLTALQAHAGALANSWHLGNWRDHVTTLADESVSLLLTDPPYGVDLQGKNRRNQNLGIPPERIRNDGAEAALTEMRDSVQQLLPKLRKDAHVLIFCHWRHEPEVWRILQDAGLEVRSLIVWAKNNHGTGDVMRTFAPKHELILYAVKGDPQILQRDPDVLEADRVSTDRHPTEKPVDLLTRLITATTVPGELVIDPFSGVASTLVAAKECERKYWGCEIDEGYHKIGKARLLE